AVLNSCVQDKIDQIQSTVLEKKLGQRALEVSLIGQPVGLLLLNGQGHEHSEDSLELFFESTKSGGQEDCVKSVAHKDSGITVIPFLSSSLPTAVENILRKGRQSGHVLNNKTMTVLPYYPIFHDSLINQPRCNEARMPDPQPQHAMESDKPDIQEHPPTPSPDDPPFIAQIIEEDGYHPAPNDNSDITNDDLDTSTSGKGQGKKFPREGGHTLLKPDPPNRERNKAQMLPLEDDHTLLPNKGANNKPGKVTFLGDYSPNGNREQHQPEPTVLKPTVSHERVKQPNEKNRGQNLARATETKTIHLPKHKIILLRISSFGRKMNNVSIELNSEKEEVKISGTREDIGITTDEMLNKLREVQQHDRKVSHETAVLLEHKMRIPDFTRQTLIGDKIYAHVTCLVKESNVRAYALQRDHAKRAVDKMLSLTDSADIGYTECHFKYLASPAWQNLVQKWEGLGQAKIKLMKPEKKIRITSLISPADMAKDIEKELEKFSNVTGKPISVDGGQGKILNYCLQGKLRQIESDVRNAGGQMDHGYKAGTYLITVQGSPSIVQKSESQLRNLTSSIWEGTIHLSRLEDKSRPPSDEEVTVMIDGLSSEKGKEFLKRFSIEHSCVVLFTPKLGSRHGSRSDEPRNINLKRSSSMPVLDPPPPRSHVYDRHQTNARVEKSAHGQNIPYQPKHRAREPYGRGNREFHGHAHRNSEDFSGQRKSERYSRLTKSIKVGNCTITVKKGSITEEMASVLVNVVGESRIFTESLISRKFCDVGGNALEKAFKRFDFGGNVVFTVSSGGLLCQNVCHMILRKWQHDQKTTLKHEIESALAETFSMAKNLRATSIAFPAVGTGRLLEYPVPFIAECMVSGAITACKKGTSLDLTDVRFVIYDPQQLEVFIKQLEEKEEDRSDYPSQRPTSQAQAPFHSPGNGRQEAISPLALPRPRSDTSPGCMTLFCTPKEKGKQLQSSLSADMRKNFLAKEKIQLHTDKVEKKSIHQLCSGKAARVKIEQDKKKITVFGERDAVLSVTKNVYKLLHESSAERAPKRYTPPDRAKHGTPVYWQELYENPPTPQYWKHFKNGYSLMDHARILFKQPSRTEIITVDPVTFRFVKSLVEKTFIRHLVGKGNDAHGLSHSQLVVRKVERIENFSLFEGYSNERRLFFKHKAKGSSRCLALEATSQQTKGAIQTSKYIDSHLLSDTFKDINEHYFFHGTDDERIKRISESGLDPRYGGNGMFGQGIYGAECSIKADQYADSAKTRQLGGRKMLLMRLLLGDMFVTSTPFKYSLPPCKTCNKEKCINHSYTYNSVVADGQWLFREFVVYDKNQCYPEYIITYDRQ
ncbi:uncharacterized protein LOC110449485, partial [Mizuhopecten yessoensis]|uniref:uncharacterized protein LOC110449485 n=1 Tax=Mizuhopecten yessoensis TaxID=6573 RepID=UPI000B4571C3